METCDDKVKLITQESNSHSGGEIKSTDLIKKINCYHGNEYTVRNKNCTCKWEQIKARQIKL